MPTKRLNLLSFQDAINKVEGIGALMHKFLFHNYNFIF